MVFPEKWKQDKKGNNFMFENSSPSFLKDCILHKKNKFEKLHCKEQLLTRRDDTVRILYPGIIKMRSTYAIVQFLFLYRLKN